MSAPEHLLSRVLVHSETALVCAVEPAAVSVPEAHLMFAAELDEVELLSSVPHPAITRAPAAARPQIAAPRRVIFTKVLHLSGAHLIFSNTRAHTIGNWY